MKKWSLWLKWGVGFGVIDVFILLIDLIFGLQGSYNLSETSWVYVPLIFSKANPFAFTLSPYVVAYQFVITGIVSFFLAGSIVGFVIQKFKQQKDFSASQKERWPLWLKWGVGFGGLGAFSVVALSLLQGFHVLGSELLETWLVIPFYPAFYLAFIFSFDHYDLSPSLGFLFIIFAQTASYFIIGSLVGLIIQKLKNRKAV